MLYCSVFLNQIFPILILHQIAIQHNATVVFHMRAKIHLITVFNYFHYYFKIFLLLPCTIFNLTTVCTHKTINMFKIKNNFTLLFNYMYLYYFNVIL